jgi:hypothetical protein
MLSAESDNHNHDHQLSLTYVMVLGWKRGEDDCPDTDLALSGDGRTLRADLFFCFTFRRTHSNIGSASQQFSKFAFQLPF